MKHEADRPGLSIELLSAANFTPLSLDGFIRTQAVTEVYRAIDGEYRLVTEPFTDDWTALRKREKAASILDGTVYRTYGALLGGRVAGFIMLEKALRQGRMVVDSFHVSQQFRRLGIGRKLFACAVDAGREAGAVQLYISACSSKETVGFYEMLGCRLADSVIREFAEDEPFDLQMVYDIRSPEPPMRA